jgi:flagellar basal-body rod protein FlgB
MGGSVMIDRINNKTIMLEKALDAAWMRNETIANNIANVNTPGFKKSYVRFEELLTDAVDKFQISGIKKDEKFLPIGKDTKFTVSPQIVREEFTSMRRDENNVDIDVEMAELAKNTIKYNALIAQMSKEFSKIKLAINGGR